MTLVFLNVFLWQEDLSGKSYTAMEIFGIDKKLQSSFSATVLKSVNSDKAFEAGLKKNGINPKDLADIEKNNPELWDKVTKTSLVPVVSEIEQNN